jgi:hypothetical protein
MFPSMGDAGSPLGRLELALRTRNPTIAWAAATEVAARGRLPLEDAVALVLLLAEADDARFDRAAARLVARLLAEVRAGSSETQLISAAVFALRGLGAHAGAQALGELAATYGLRRVANVVNLWLARRRA